MRKWLWKALCQIVINHAYSNLYLKEHLEELPKNEQAAAVRILYGTLQNYRLCREIWLPFIHSKVSRKIEVLLTMSVYQLKFMESMPDYAIINEAVRLAGTISLQSAKFVNAVLRKAAKADLIISFDTLENAAKSASLPNWLLSMWKAQYGDKQAVELAKATLAELPVYVRINPLKMDKDELEQAAEAGILKKMEMDESGYDQLYIYSGKSLKNDPLFLEGKISAMDPGSYEIARLCQIKPGMKLLDLCAAPGTKSNAAAEMMNNQGRIDAFDLHEHRTKLIDQDAKRLGVDIIRSHTADSSALGLYQPFEQDHEQTDQDQTSQHRKNKDQMGQIQINQNQTDLDQKQKLPAESGFYDVVLCDVPCSGYGILSRKPDMKVHLDSTAMDTLIPLQKQLLETAARNTAKGGALVYSTCTLNKKENEKQVESFLEKHPEFKLQSMKTMMADEKHGGFFMARMEREK